MPHHNNEILGKLKRAQSIQEIDALLAEAAMFEHAKPKTLRRQQRIADKRRAELEDEQP